MRISSPIRSSYSRLLLGALAPAYHLLFVPLVTTGLKLVRLFTNWLANRSPRDKVVQLSMRSLLRHIVDAVVISSLERDSPGTGKRHPGAHSLRHSAALPSTGWWPAGSR